MDDGLENDSSYFTNESLISEISGNKIKITIINKKVVPIWA
jgi:hypothetical protein